MLFAIMCLVAGCDTAAETAVPAEPSSTVAPTQPAAVTVAITPPTLIINITPIIQGNRPTATPACASLPRTRLVIGNRAQVSDDDETPLNVRSGPSTEFRILGRLNVMERFLVISGPECSSEYVWYQVRSDSGLEGWIAEGVPGLYFVEPYPPG